MAKRTLIALFLCAAFIGAGAPGPAHMPPPPAGRAFIGGFFGERAAKTHRLSPGEAAQDQERNAERLEAQIGHPLAFLVQYADPDFFNSGAWRSDPRLLGDRRYHRMPFISWSVKWNLNTYLSGMHDRDIDNAAMAMKSFPGPVLFRPFHEFNLCLNGSSRSCHGNADVPDAFTQGDPLERKQALFIAWWKYVWHRMVVVDGATNVLWVWNPAYGPEDRSAPRKLERFLPTASGNPGDGPVVDVDYIGLDAYDVGGKSGFGDVFSRFYGAFSRYGLPLAYVESGEVSQDCGGVSSPYTQARWFADLMSSAPTTFPQMKIYSYFDSWSAYPNCERDWLFDSGGQAGFISAARDPYFSAMGS
jgi:hypothetical protein